MRPLGAGDITGVWGTVLLPVAADESIDTGRLAVEIDVLVASGLHGLYAHGTAGEPASLDDAEHARVSEMLAARCEAAGLPFQLGTGHPSARTTLERVRRARELWPGAVQVTLPGWQPLGVADVHRFLERVASVADPVPLVLYSPPHATTRVDPALLGVLLDRHPQVVGLKTAGGDAAWFAAVREQTARCSVFVPGHLMASGLAAGAHGSYSDVAALSPRGARAWYELARSDPAAALEVEQRIRAWMGRHVTPLQAAGFADQALDKLLAAVGGWAPVGVRTRWPHAGVDEARVPPARLDALRSLPDVLLGAG